LINDLRLERGIAESSCRLRGIVSRSDFPGERVDDSHGLNGAIGKGRYRRPRKSREAETSISPSKNQVTPLAVVGN
jgi:hypothetical protein